MKLFGLVGAGGFGREVMPLVNAILKKVWMEYEYELVFLEEEKNHIGLINQFSVMTIDAFFAHPCTEKYFNIAIANHEVRQRIAKCMMDRGAVPYRINALNSIELDNNDIAEGAIFCPYTTVTSNVKIGKFFHANIYSYVAHDCCIGDYVTFAPNVHCNGGVIIEDFAYIGTGAIIKQGSLQNPIIIGKGATVGMGAVVTKSVNAFDTVVGNPARTLIKKDMIKAT